MNWFYLVLGIIIGVVLLRAEHCLRRSKERKCLCGSRTKRIHQMVPYSHDYLSASRSYTIFGQYFEPHTFNVCSSNCRRVVCVKSGVKWFPFFEIWWRRLLYPQEFNIDYTLFSLAGLTGNALPFIVRMRIERERARREAKHLEQIASFSRPR